MSDLAVNYYRMSGDTQEESIPSQKARVEPHFREKYKTVEVYQDEGKSGSKDTHKRDGFLRMIHDVTEGKWKGKVKTIICLDLSRFGRLDTIEGARYKEALRRAKVKLDTVIDGLIDWNTSIGRIVDSVKSEGNHDLSLLIGQKGLQGRIRVTKAGIPNQTTPYGMAKKINGPAGEFIIGRNQPFSKPKTWDSEFCPGEPEEVAAMKFLFETYMNEDTNYSQLALKLHKKGFPEPTGQGWRADSIAWMLRNPVYAGGLRIGEVSKGKFFRVSGGQETAIDKIEGKSDPVVVWDTHKGIISKELFDAVQVKIKNRFKTRGRARRNGPYSLTGIVCCGNCGQPMYGSKLKDGRVYYRCHRQEVDRSQSCGFWIAYEKDLLPWLLTKYPALLRETAVTEFALIPFGIKDKEAVNLQAVLEKLDKKLEQGRERFLDASPAIAKGLGAMLEKWERERTELVAKIVAKQGKGWSDKLLARFNEIQSEFANSIELPGAGPVIHIPDRVMQARIRIPASQLRERLKRINTRVLVWFKRKEKGKGYNLAKVQVTAAIPLCTDEASKAAS